MTPEQIANLPDVLLASGTDLDKLAADRICDLEVEVFRLRAQLAQLREQVFGAAGHDSLALAAQRGR